MTILPPALTPVRQDASTALRDRLLVIGGENARATTERVDPTRGGMVFTGASALTELRKAREAFPHLLLIAEPTAAATYAATPDQPYALPSEGLWPVSLDEVITGQREAGASIVLLPFGFVAAKDAKTLRAIVEASNALEADDLAVPLVVDKRWLSDDDVPTLIAAIKRITHPVLVAFSDRQRPVSTLREHRNYRRVFAETGAFAWRADLGGFDAIAHGAHGFALGSAPSSRRATPPGKGGYSGNKADRTPHILDRGRLTYVRGSALRDIYRAQNAPGCPCTICKGMPLDRFYDSSEDRLDGELHGVVVGQEMHSSARESGDVKIWWSDSRTNAVLANETLSKLVGRPIELPESVSAWSKVD